MFPFIHIFPFFLLSKYISPSPFDILKTIYAWQNLLIAFIFFSLSHSFSSLISFNHNISNCFHFFPSVPYRRIFLSSHFSFHFRFTFFIFTFFFFFSSVTPFYLSPLMTIPSFRLSRFFKLNITNYSCNPVTAKPPHSPTPLFILTPCISQPSIVALSNTVMVYTENEAKPGKRERKVGKGILRSKNNNKSYN